MATYSWCSTRTTHLYGRLPRPLPPSRAEASPRFLTIPRSTLAETRTSLRLTSWRGARNFLQTGVAALAQSPVLSERLGLTERKSRRRPPPGRARAHFPRLMPRATFVRPGGLTDHQLDDCPLRSSRVRPTAEGNPGPACSEKQLEDEPMQTPGCRSLLPLRASLPASLFFMKGC